MVRSAGRALRKKLWKYHPNSMRCSCRAWRLYRSIPSAKQQSQETDVMFVHYREKFSHVFRQKKRYFYFTAFIHSIRSSKIEPHDFSKKYTLDLWIAVQSIWNFMEISQMFCIVIHRHNDERETAARWQKL